MFCSKCGKEVSDNSLYCDSCGSKIGNNTGYQNSEYQSTGYQNTGYQNTDYQNTGYQNTGYQYQNMNPANLDKNSVGLNILSFFIPIVGLILFLVNLKNSPIKARGIGIWSLVGFIIGLIFYNL